MHKKRTEKLETKINNEINDKDYIESSASKFIKLYLQGLVGACFIIAASEASKDVMGFVSYNQDSIKQVVGNNYYVLKYGSWLLSFTSILSLGYVAMKGTGGYVKQSIKKQIEEKE